MPREQSSLEGAERLARALGWLSLGLGIAGVAFPRRLANLIGVRDRADNRAFLFKSGLREIASGIGLLTQWRPAIWVWSRVAGDALDLTFLGGRLNSGDARRRNRVLAAIVAVVGVAAVDVYCGIQLRRRRSTTANRASGEHGKHSRNVITVRRSPEEVYRYWRDFANLPQFMSHLESVRVIGDRLSHWKAEAPLGMTVEWDAEIIEDRPNELIAWRSREGATVENAGQVRFRPAPGGRGTEIDVEMQYSLPGGVLGEKVAMLFGKEPSQEVQGDLRRLKQVLETGEVVRSDATLKGSRIPQRPAQPPPDAREFGMVAR